MRTSLPRTMAAARLICGLLAAAGSLAASPSVRAPDSATQLIHDPSTGLALFGYDPVAYLTDGQAVLGRLQHGAEALGRTWRFASAANRAAFLADPLPYLPLFGGHDGRGVGEGRMVRGDPAIFLVAGGMTVLFRTAADRDAFAADPALRKAALQGWPRLAAQFAGH